MQWTFTPTDDIRAGIAIPFFEDARADFAPYYDIRGKDRQTIAKSEISQELSKLGAVVTDIQQGIFGFGKTKRHGFNIMFIYSGQRGLIRVAGLPIRGIETERKVTLVLNQALLNVRDWLKAAVTSQVFSPGSYVLIPFLLMDGKRTVADVLVEQGRLLEFNPPPDINALPAPNSIGSN